MKYLIILTMMLSACGNGKPSPLIGIPVEETTCMVKTASPCGVTYQMCADGKVYSCMNNTMVNGN